VSSFDWRSPTQDDAPAVADLVIGSALGTFGRVDTLVNNAGMFISKPFTEYTEADFEGFDFG